MLATYLAGLALGSLPVRPLRRARSAIRGGCSGCSSPGRRERRWATLARPRRVAARRPDVRGHVGDARDGPRDARGRRRASRWRRPSCCSADDVPRRRLPGRGPAGRRRAPTSAADVGTTSRPSTPPAGSRARSSPASSSFRGSGSSARSEPWPSRAPLLGAVAIAEVEREGRRRARRSRSPWCSSSLRSARSSRATGWPRCWRRSGAGRSLFYEEDTGGTVAVLEQAAGRGRFRRLYIQGVSNSGDAPASLRYMRLQALLPLLIHSGEPRSALVVGFGTGITAGALLADPGLETARRRRAVARGRAGGSALLRQPRRGDGPAPRDPHRRRPAGAAAPRRSATT